MRVLAIDTSSNVATVAVMEDELLLGEYILNHKKTHSQKIMTMIEQILSELELTVQDIDIFAAAIGPGSFTGLRIGVATVKALAHATGKPVVSVGTLEALAYNVPYAEHIIVPIMDARRDNVFTASYIWDEGFKEIGEPEAISIDECLESCGEFLDTIFVGDGVKVHREYIKEKLGDNMGVAALPTVTIDGKEGQMKSFIGSKAIGVNPNAENMQVAMALAAYLAGEDAQKDHYDMRNILPTNTNIAVDDEIAAAVADAMINTSIMQPLVPEMSNYWSPAENMGKALVAGEITADNAAEKTEDMNTTMNTDIAQ